MDTLTYPSSWFFRYVLDDETFSEEQRTSFKNRCAEFDAEKQEEVNKVAFNSLNRIRESYDEIKAMTDQFRFLNGFPEFTPGELMTYAMAPGEIGADPANCAAALELILVAILPAWRVMERLIEVSGVDPPTGGMVTEVTSKMGMMPDVGCKELTKKQLQDLELIEAYGIEMHKRCRELGIDGLIDFPWLCRLATEATYKAKHEVDSATSSDEVVLRLLGPLAPGKPIEELMEVILQSKARSRKKPGDFMGALATLFGKPTS